MLWRLLKVKRTFCLPMHSIPCTLSAFKTQWLLDGEGNMKQTIKDLLEAELYAYLDLWIGDISNCVSKLESSEDEKEKLFAFNGKRKFSGNRGTGPVPPITRFNIVINSVTSKAGETFHQA